MKELDMNNIINTFQLLKQNPLQVLSRRFNLPQNIDLNNPNNIIQHLLNTGQVSQDQVNQAMKMKDNPLIQQILNIK